MICELYIQNVAVIEKINISFEKGMSVLTGETGAGKSIIIDSINMILGNKADKSLIRYGEEKATVQAVFEVNDETEKMLYDKGIECEERELIITRTLSAEGKNTARLNGIAVPVSVLREISPFLINIHGQHDNQALLTPSKHVSFLDAYAENDKELSEYKKIYSELKNAESSLSELQINEDERLRRIDLLEYQTNEIREADLKDDEEEQLKEQRDRVVNAEKITSSAAEVKEVLYEAENGTVYDGIYQCVKALERISGLDESIDKAHSDLTDMLYAVEDIVHNVTAFADNTEYDEQVLNDIEERLDVYSRMKRKYGSSVNEIREFYNEASEELETLQSVDENTERLTKELGELTRKLDAASQKLSILRKKAASTLEKKIENALHELNMEQASFRVSVENAENFLPNGADNVEFLISTNAGEPQKPLVKIASGGELSRVMLAMKSILAECDGVETLIFDEIDTGVSGNAAQKIADKLSAISRFRQVICITHLPQLASMADNHYFIEKNIANEKTVTTVTGLKDDEKITEIARMTGGELTEISKEHAGELIRKANERKCKQKEL